MTDIPKSSKKQIPDAVLRKVESMDPVNQAAFLDEFNKKRKSGFMAFVLLIFFGLHYAYLGRIWITLIYWLTLAGWASGLSSICFECSAWFVSATRLSLSTFYATFKF